MSGQLLGFLNVNKPRGWTSRDVVNVVQKLVRPAKAGHAGTLDPLATGVLVVAVGRATRLIEYVQRAAKEYVAEFRFGQTSDTEDVEGNVTPLENPPRPGLDELRAAARSFLGQIEQRPPAFSALKVKGRRAYELARKGERVELAPRPVRIDALEIERYDYPTFRARIRCGGGTYIRSLGRDIAESLGTGAVMSSLERAAIGPFRVRNAITPGELTKDKLDRFFAPVESAIADMPRIHLTAAELERLGHGQPVSASAKAAEGGECAAFNAAGQFVAILRAQKGRWKIARNLLVGARE